MNFDTTDLYYINTRIRGKRMSLYNLAVWKNGLAFKNIDFSDTGVPVIKIAELNNGISATTAYTMQTFSEEVHLQKGDLLFAWSGNPKTSIDIFRFDLDEGWLNQHIFKITVDETIVDFDYFYFLMKYLKPYFSQIAMNKQTTGLGHVTIGDLKRISVVIPDLSIQRAIVRLIKPLHEKIQINLLINKNLEEQASTYFNEWFSSITGEAVELSSVIDVRDGTHDSPKAQEDGYPLVTSKHLLPFDLDLASPNKISEDDFNKVNERSKVEQNDILMSMIGTVGLISFIHQDVINFAIKNVALFRTSQAPELALYLLMYLKSEKITQHIDMCLAGSTQKYISLSELRKIPFIIPTKTAIQEFNQVIKPMIGGICNNVRENSRLAELRDALLPKLMSGEIDVSEL